MIGRAEKSEAGDGQIENYFIDPAMK